jgi:hypothetical protein
MDDTSIDPRSAFGFAEAALVAFGFLVEQGFEPDEVCSTLVRFRRGAVVANVYHGRRSYEIRFEVVRERQTWTIGSILAMVDPVKAEEFRYARAVTPDAVPAGLAQLAAVVQQYAAPALNDDSTFYRALEEWAARWRTKYEMDVREKQVRPKANAAFKAGEYAKAVLLYLEIEERLTPVERQKLELARRRS